MSKKNAKLIEASLAVGKSIQEINEYLFKKQQAKRRLKKKMKYNKKAKIFLGLNTNAM